MANTKVYKQIEEHCLSRFLNDEGLTIIQMNSTNTRDLFGKMEPDILAYNSDKGWLCLGEFSASGYFGLDGKVRHIGGNRKLAESFLKLFLCHMREKEILKYFSNYNLKFIRYIFAVPKGALFLKGLTYQRDIFKRTFLELVELEMEASFKSILENSYKNARAEQKD